MIDVRDYSKINKKNISRQQADGRKLFEIQFYGGNEGYFVDVDEYQDLMMLIQEHTNPLNEGLVDRKARFLSNPEIYRLGNMITCKNNGDKYLSVTEPKDNGIQAEYRIRKTDGTLVFRKGEEATTSVDGVLASGLLYRDGSYTNQSNVFEDNEMKAMAVQYNDTTRRLALFDSVQVNGRSYKVVKIEDDVLKQYGDNHGVLQLVLLLSPTSKLERVNVIDDTSTEFKGITKYARVKDRKLNSVSRELLCEYGAVKTGDYVRYTFDSNDRGDMKEEVYIIFNTPSKYDGYDISLAYRCLNSFLALGEDGVIHRIPYYFEDNRTRVDKVSANAYLNQLDSSFMIITQENDVTRRFVDRKVSRVILKNAAYKVTGVSNHDEGLLYLGLEIDKTDPQDDRYGVANYVSQIDNTGSGQATIIGEKRIFGGFDWPYELIGVNISPDTIWAVDSNKVRIRACTDTTCVLVVASKYEMGTKVRLTATQGGQEYVKEIILE